MKFRKVLKEVWAGETQPWARAVVVDNLVFCAGQGGIDPNTGKVVEGGVVAQAEMAFERIKRNLEEAGTSFKNVVYYLIILRHAEDYEAVEKVIRKHIPHMEDVPNTLIEAGLGFPEMLCEFEFTAIIPDRE